MVEEWPVVHVLRSIVALHGISRGEADVAAVVAGGKVVDRGRVPDLVDSSHGLVRDLNMRPFQ